MQMRDIGDLRVGAIGLGAMQVSVREVNVPEEQAVATIHAALDAGVTLIDTADAYSPDEHAVGHNERVVATALARYGADTGPVLVATKGGHTRLAGGGWGLDGRPEHLRRACEASLKALGVDRIGLYQYHRPDPKVPYAESIGALRELRDAGKVRLVGISNADLEQIRVAQQVLGDSGLASVQNEFSPRFRSSEGELRYCAEQGIAFLPWSPLGGVSDAGGLGSYHPAFAEIAAERGVSPQQVCLAWMLAKAPVVIPIPGASRPESARDSAAAAELVLSEEELARLG
jgi:aryl-alcohol dehydrogenase-like predicted oxidoreductase